MSLKTRNFELLLVNRNLRRSELHGVPEIVYWSEDFSSASYGWTSVYMVGQVFICLDKCLYDHLMRQKIQQLRRHSLRMEPTSAETRRNIISTVTWCMRSGVLNFMFC